MIRSCRSCARAFPWAVKASATSEQLSAQPQAEEHIQQALVELFGEEPDLELGQDQEQEEPQATAPISVRMCSLQSLGGSQE